jgi:peroxiredoxin
MTTSDPQAPLQPGEPAPDFTLPAVHREGTISSSDYRGKTPVLVALFRGLWCPFCRRAIAQLGTAREKLAALGVDTLAVVATTPENARLYFKFRPTRVPLVADPELTTHQAFRLPKPPVTPELLEGIQAVRVNPNGWFPEPMSLGQAGETLDKQDRFMPTETDNVDRERQFPQLKGQFLVDRTGIIRWSHIECEEGLAGLGRFPTDAELVAAARALPA